MFPPPPQSKVHSMNKMHESPTIRLCRNTYFVPKVLKKTPITLKKQRFQQIKEKCILQLKLICLLFNLRQMACWSSPHFLPSKKCLDWIQLKAKRNEVQAWGRRFISIVFINQTNHGSLVSLLNGLCARPTSNK